MDRNRIDQGQSCFGSLLASDTAHLRLSKVVLDDEFIDHRFDLRVTV